MFGSLISVVGGNALFSGLCKLRNLCSWRYAFPRMEHILHALLRIRLCSLSYGGIRRIAVVSGVSVLLTIGALWYGLFNVWWFEGNSTVQ